MREIILLVVRNAARHPLRSFLTALGIFVALFAYCFIHTMIRSWYAGVEASAKDRLVVRNAVSLVFYLPVSYYNAIAKLPGVEKLGWGNWFGGIYKDEARTRFQQFAINETYLGVYPEYQLSAQAIEAFLNNRKGALVGHDIAERYDLKDGDNFSLQGTIFPGVWDFTVSGIFDSNKSDEDTRVVFFHWDYLNERNKLEDLRMPDHVGFYVVQVAPGYNPATVAQDIDALFANSSAETLTETETQFVQSFVAMSSTIITALHLVSYVVIGIMLLVLSNTMLMSARERHREYSILRGLGFHAWRIYVLILGESILLVGAGILLLSGVLLVVFNLPPHVVLGPLKDFFPTFALKPSTFVSAVGLGLLIAIASGVVPASQVARASVAHGLRRLG